MFALHQKTLDLQTTLPDKAPVIEVVDVYKSFRDNRVLRGINLQLYAGENLVVLGKSGSGKSVLIKCIAGLIRPDAGQIKIMGQDITQLCHDELDQVRANIGFLFQAGALYDSMTVRENLEFPLHHYRAKYRQEEVDELTKEVLENVGLQNAIDLMPAELSGGMRKRIGLARTLIMKPKIILYDEPTTGLDPVTARGISELIVSVQQKYGAAAIIITHDMACARTTGNRVVVLAEGIFQAAGTYKELEQSPNPFVKEFFENAEPDKLNTLNNAT